MKKIAPLLLALFIAFSDAQSVYDVGADHVQWKNGTLFLTDNVSLVLDKTAIHSDQMKVAFLNGQIGAKSVETLVAEGHVVINHGNLFTATGKRVEYSGGAVIMYPDEEIGYCTVSNEDGLLMKMQKGLYDPETGELVLLLVNGYMKLEDKGLGDLHFEADKMLWDNDRLQLTLIDDIKIEVPGSASLANDDRVSFTWKDVAGTKVLSQLTSTGRSKLQNFDYEGDEAFIVDYDGAASYNAQQGWLAYASKPGSEIHYYDQKGHAFGKELFVDLLPNTTTPQKIYLNEEIKLLAGVVVVDGELKGASQYVLADTLKIDPKEKTLVLDCSGGRRVLFCDRMNQLQMSAPKLVMKQHPGMDKPSVKGIGDVRFKLMEQELEQIKKRFYFDEEEQES